MTIPNQTIDDYQVKYKCLNNFIKSITRFKGCRCYIWKSEAQERGDIHFHLVIDCFIFEREARKIWYRLLRNNGLISESLSEKLASRICYFTMIKDIDYIGEMIGAYFETERDDNGKLKHKHKADHNVRDISGRSWGSSDNLKIPSLILYDINSNYINYLNNHSFGKKDILNDSQEKIASVYFNSKYIPKSSGTKGYKDRINSKFVQLCLDYHYQFAKDIYGTGSNSDRKGIDTLDKIKWNLSESTRCLIGIND